MFGSLSIDSFLFSRIASQCSSIQQFFYIQFRRIRRSQFSDFFVRLTDDFIVQSQTRTTQLRKNSVSQFFVYSRDVFDFAFSLSRVLIHCNNAEDQLFVLDVRFRNQFLETFPVLCSIFSIDRSVDFCFLQVFAQQLSCVVFAVFSKSSIQAYTTIRRSVCRNFDVADLLVSSFVYVSYFFVEFFSSLQLAGTNVSLLDQEHDVSIVFFFDDTLESVFAQCRVSVT